MLAYTRSIVQERYSSCRNYLSYEVLAYNHVCQSVGSADPLDEEPYQGTAKSAEGHGLTHCFANLKAGGVQVAIHWQDGDSSSEKAFCQSYPSQDSVIVFCRGHVGRQHRRQLQALSKMKRFTENYVARHQDLMSEKDLELRCDCPRKHKKGCECMNNQPCRVKLCQGSS